MSPLAEAGVCKEDARRLLKFFNAPNAEKPPESCLATRIPFGVELTERRLKMVAHLEATVKNLAGVRLVRARWRGENEAVLEVLAEEIVKLLENREDVVKAAEEIGFERVSVDLRGYVPEKLRSRAL